MDMSVTSYDVKTANILNIGAVTKCRNLNLFMKPNRNAVISNQARRMHDIRVKDGKLYQGVELIEDGDVFNQRQGLEYFCRGLAALSDKYDEIVEVVVPKAHSIAGPILVNCMKREGVKFPDDVIIKAFWALLDSCPELDYLNYLDECFEELLNKESNEKWRAFENALDIESVCYIVAGKYRNCLLYDLLDEDSGVTFRRDAYA